MRDWSLHYEGFDPAMERLRETLCVIGNGYFATRGAAPEAAACDTHYPATYVAGCYNRLESQVGDRMIENEDFVNVPNWLPLSFRIENSDWFDLSQVELLSYAQELDMRHGLLLRDIRFKDAMGRVTALHDTRFVHMGLPHFAGLKTRIRAENWSGRLGLRSALDGAVINDGVTRYRALNQQHLAPVSTGSDGDCIWIKVKTVQSDIAIAQAARTRVLLDGADVQPERLTSEREAWVGQDFELEIQEGQSVEVEKVVALYTSRDNAISECELAARTAIARAPDFETLKVSQAEAWEYIWDQCDIGMSDGPEDEVRSTLATLRLHMFHLLQTASPNSLDLDVGIPPRGLHGEAYRGHIFWDEVFIFPFLNLRLPEITRGLLLYRYRRLDEARAAAQAAGYRGAMYPWQSGSNGREESQQVHLNPLSGRWIPDNSSLQRHVNAAIAYNAWQYYQATADLDFLCFHGAEMILELARFWASTTTYNKALDRYEILGVMGPDEYHDGYPDREEPGLDNNSYSNVMAVWVICRALDVLEILPTDHRRRLSERLGLTAEETAHWNGISRKMRLVFHDDGVLSQFEGWDKLEELDWEGLKERHGDIRRLDRVLEAEGDTPNRYKAAKQADVLMLFYLFSPDELGELFERLGYPFDEDTIRRNLAYYFARTADGSSLSQVVHAWVQARFDRDVSWQLFRGALVTDVDDHAGGTTQEGVHLGAMAATVDIVQRAYTGIETRGDVLYVNPRLPKEIENLRLRVRFRGHSLGLHLRQKAITIKAEYCVVEPITIGVAGRLHALVAGEVLELQH